MSRKPQHSPDKIAEVEVRKSLGQLIDDGRKAADEAVKNMLAAEKTVIAQLASVGLEIPASSLSYMNKKDEGLMQEPQVQGAIDARLTSYLADKGVPEGAWAAISNELTLLIDRAKIPKWGDKEKPDHLKRLTAPEFLKIVHANAIKNNVVNKEEIRAIDAGLMAAVEAYIATRKRRQLDAGEARGLVFELSHPARNAPRPTSAKPRALAS